MIMITKRKYNKHNNPCSYMLGSRVPKYIYDKVHELANETNRSVSDIICIILDSYFQDDQDFNSQE